MECLKLQNDTLKSSWKSVQDETLVIKKFSLFLLF